MLWPAALPGDPKRIGSNVRDRPAFFPVRLSDPIDESPGEMPRDPHHVGLGRIFPEPDVTGLPFEGTPSCDIGPERLHVGTHVHRDASAEDDVTVECHPQVDDAKRQMAEQVVPQSGVRFVTALQFTEERLDRDAEIP